MSAPKKSQARGILPRKHLLPIISIWALGIFVFDLTMPLGFAGGVPYVVLVLLSLFSPQTGFAYATAAVASLLTVLGYFLSPPGGVLWVVLLNRGLAIGVIWVTAILLNQYRSASKASRRAEAALRESEAKLKTVTEKALDAIIMADHEGRVLYWNAASERMFGYRPEEALGQHLAQLILPESKQALLETDFRELSKTGRGRLIGKALEMTARKKDGTALSIEHAFSAVKIQGEWGAVGIMRDITRRKEEVASQFSRLNMEHQRIVQLEKLSAMGLMIGEIAHQINNPLVGVINMAQLALREKSLSENSREFLEDIQNAGEDCRAFLQRMLDFSKTSQFSRKSTALKPLIEETLLLCQQSLGQRVSLRSELPKESITLEVDPILLRHALFNLITNAIQAVATQAGDCAEIIVELSTQNRNQESGWALSVRDRGPGLSEAIIDKIFTPFFTTRRAGTGLGLALVEHVAMLHGGTIEACNPSGGGAQFTLWLPESTQGIRTC